MLGRLTMRTVRLLDVHIERSGGLSTEQNEEDENSFVVDLDALRALLLPTPNNAWRRVTGACNALAPICLGLHDTLCSDFENVAQVLLELECRHDDTFQDVLPVGLLEIPGKEAAIGNRLRDSCLIERSKRKRRRSSQSLAPLVIPSTHPSAPTIIISFSLPQTREASSPVRVPLQDYSFGNILTVPSHPSYNKIHPPMTLSHASVPRLDQWRWTNGHWKAILPTLGEQTRRSMFSRPIHIKRKSTRRP